MLLQNLSGAPVTAEVASSTLVVPAISFQTTWELLGKPNDVTVAFIHTPLRKLAGPFASRLSVLQLGFQSALYLEVERYCLADEILQRSLVDLLAFVDVDGAPHIPIEARVE